MFDCWYFQLSSTLTPSTGGGGKGSPSSPGKKNKILDGNSSFSYIVTKIYNKVPKLDDSVNPFLE